MTTPTSHPRRCLSVVVPCFNEEPTIGSLLERVLASPWVDEVIVIDDGSTDKTQAIVLSIADNRIRMVRQSRNRGKGAALRIGIALAASEYVVVQDADLEYDPRDYPALLEALESGVADVVFGSRFVSGRPHRVLFFWHSLGNRFLTLLSNAFTDLNLTDMETGYKMFRREIIQSIDIRENRFGFEPEITAKVAGLRCRVYEVGISYTGRAYDEGKKIGWRDGLWAIVCIVRYSPMWNRRRSTPIDRRKLG